jgi:hypothetical protein
MLLSHTHTHTHTHIYIYILEIGRDCTWDWMWTWFGNLSKTLVALGPPVSIEDHLLLWMVVRSQTYYPKHILAYESEKIHYFLVMGSDSFQTDY